MYEALIGPAYDKSGWRLQRKQLGLHMRRALATYVPYVQTASGVTNAPLMGKLCMAYAPEAVLVRVTRDTSTTTSTTLIETSD